MNTVTKFHLVYECLELKVFYPGQLIMSVHQRSPLCTEFAEVVYKDGTSKFRREIDNKIMKQMGEGSKTLYTGFIHALNQDEKVNSNTSKVHSPV